MSRLFLSEKTYVVQLETYHIAWVSSRENLIVLHANHKGTDQPAQSRSLISAFFVLSLESTTIIITLTICNTVKPVLSGRSKIDKT